MLLNSISNLHNGSNYHLLIAIPLFVLNIAISLAITIPFVGILIRYRAHYSPKAVQLDSEFEGAQTQTGPVIHGYFSTFKRVYKLEVRLSNYRDSSRGSQFLKQGWSGLYKGAMPVFLSVLLLFPLSILRLILRNGLDPDKPKLEDLRGLGVFALGIVSLLVSLPFTILQYRAIVTPFKLPYFDIKRNLRTLLTPTERARPWTLYLTPGLLVAQVLKVLVSLPVLTGLQNMVLPELPQSKEEFDGHFILRLSIYVILIVVGTSIIVPLDIITARLAIQRNHALQTDNSAVRETDGLALYSAEEDVIG
ncbi:hypothetical protein H0H87_009436 [Tephrocybe sp. NHM501043]|nr:hypothetical protein H0H87_009436 [Tephrocybe sp. NHM501043]